MASMFLLLLCGSAIALPQLPIESHMRTGFSPAADAPPTPGCPNSAFQMFWNIVFLANATCQGPCQYLDNSPLAQEYLFTAGNQTFTQGGGGLFPYCSSSFNRTTNQTQYSNVNGGIPQWGNLSAHLEKLEKDIVEKSLFGPLNATGNCVFDFEMWRPVFVGQWNDDCYQEESIIKVKTEHPDWTNATQIFEQAQLEFETAAVAYFVESLELGKKLIPGAHWGFYGFPANLNGPCDNTGDNPECGYHNPNFGPLQRAINDEKMGTIWAASTGIFPSLYLWPGEANVSDPSHFSRNQDYVLGVTQESVRLRDKFAPNVSAAKVRPFAWNDYMSSTGDTYGDLKPWDLQMTLEAPRLAGADDLVWWGAPWFSGKIYNNSHAESLADFYAFLNTTFGPAVRSAVMDNCACSAANCSGHGACIGNGTCRCLPGFTGPSCRA